jgi:hypothetical protein
MTAASLTPRMTSKANSHTPIADTTTASTVSPSPKPGTSALSVAVMSTQYEVLPAQADAQYPMAELNPT